jgi:isopenicillin N synthase-like dioxygenase
MDEVFAQSKKFFDLPHSEKMKLLRDGKNRGYTPMLDEILDPENQVNGKLFETPHLLMCLNLFFQGPPTC